MRLLVLLAGAVSSHAAVRHPDVSLITYVDFATNCGRFATGTTNALLEHIREREGGVRIHYLGGQSPYTLPHGMISFDSVADEGHITSVGPNYVVSVAHNATRLYPVFSGNELGAEHAPRYVTMEEYGAENRFVHHIFHGAMNDYKLARLCRVVTDAPAAAMTGGANAAVKGELVYRVGGGLQLLRGADGKDSDESIQSTYLVGGVARLVDWSTSHDDKKVQLGVVVGTPAWDASGVSESTPLPFGSTPGDSGSPYFIWDGGEYRFLMAHRGSTAGNRQTQGCGALEWSRQVMAADSFCVDMGKVQGAVVISGAKQEADKGGMSDVVNGTRFTASAARGYLRDANGNLYDKNWNASFGAVESGQHTWKSLSPLKDLNAWYAYGHDYLNATESVVVVDKEVKVAGGLTYASLFQTQNLVFEAAGDKSTYTLRVDEDTDLGLGYLHVANQGYKDVSFDLVSEKNKQFDSAGFVVDAGVTLHVRLCHEKENDMREWRKVGEGQLHICGSGKNEIFLNLGGTGCTMLNQQQGYAAYNVLLNTGAVLRIKDPEQIYRSLTFGNGGGTLDMNGCKMDWYLSGDAARDGFTIHALTEEACISNASGHAGLVFREAGEHTFAGSFCDSETGSLDITYSGGGTWTLNGIRTRLTHPSSHFTVQNGTVKLGGTLTRHGIGTLHTRESAGSLVRKNDWHYADATMNVVVKDGAVFELESHARLTGMVTVEKGGRYVMHPGVHAEKEYIEGGEQLENTADIADFYGHKGAVKLAAGASLQLQPGTRADLRLLELRHGSRIEASGALLAVEQVALVLESPYPGQLSRGEFQGVKEIRHPKGKFMMLKPGRSMIVVNAAMAPEPLELSCRKLVVDFQLKLPLRGLVQVRLGKKLCLQNPRDMRIEARYGGRTIRGFYIPETPDSVYFYLW